MGGNFIAVWRGKTKAKIKTLGAEVKNEGAVGFLECVLVWKGKVKKGGATPYPNFYNVLCDISLLTISSNRLVSHYLKMYIHR